MQRDGPGWDKGADWRFLITLGTCYSSPKVVAVALLGSGLCHRDQSPGLSCSSVTALSPPPAEGHCCPSTSPGEYHPSLDILQPRGKTISGASQSCCNAPVLNQSSLPPDFQLGEISTALLTEVGRVLCTHFLYFVSCPWLQDSPVPLLEGGHII